MLKDIPDEQGIEMDQLGVSNIRYSTALINDNDLFLSNQELLPSLDSPPIRGDVSRPNKPELSAANLDETPMKREETPPRCDSRLPATVRMKRFSRRTTGASAAPCGALSLLLSSGSRLRKRRNSKG